MGWHDWLYLPLLVPATLWCLAFHRRHWQLMCVHHDGDSHRHDYRCLRCGVWHERESD